MPIFQPELETLPRPELERIQRERLRERFGIELEALPELPFRVKAELRDAYPFGLLQVPLEECVRIHASSGTRGKATIVAYTRADLAVGQRLGRRGIHDLDEEVILVHVRAVARLGTFG